MSFDDVVGSRRSIRKYTSEDVSDVDIRKIVECGILAPSAKNRQPWRIKVVSDDLKDKIALFLESKKSDVKNSTYSKYLTIIETYIISLLGNINFRNLSILLGLFSGIRVGEICGLRWSDLDFINNTLSVNRTAQRIKNLDDESS